MHETHKVGRPGGGPAVCSLVRLFSCAHEAFWPMAASPGEPPNERTARAEDHPPRSPPRPQAGDSNSYTVLDFFGICVVEYICGTFVKKAVGSLFRSGVV